MIVTVFFICSVFIVLLFLLNQIRFTRISFFLTICCYLLALITYFVLTYYLEEWTRAQTDGLNLGLLALISFSMIFHIYQSQGQK